jgi:hypothetical protein
MVYCDAALAAKLVNPPIPTRNAVAIKRFLFIM